MLIELAVAAILMTKTTTEKPTPPKPAQQLLVSGPELVRTIKSDIESVAGPGSVDVSIDNKSLYSVRVAVPSFRSEICNPIYDVELKLYRYFPDLNFDFYLRLKQ